jgi:hypothetical protein
MGLRCPDVYQFFTYNCGSEENDCNNNLGNNIAHNGLSEYWTYIYHGYSRKLKNTYSYVKLIAGENAVNQTAKHFIPLKWTFLL